MIMEESPFESEITFKPLEVESFNHFQEHLNFTPQWSRLVQTDTVLPDIKNSDLFHVAQVWKSPPIHFTYIDILITINRWLSTPAIRDQMCFEPKEIYDSNNQRIYNDFTDSDEAIQLFNCIFTEDQTKPLPIFIIIDLDTNTTSTSATPIRIINGNLPRHLQRQHSDTIGVLPHMETSGKHSGWRRNHLLQNCLQVLLSPFSNGNSYQTLKGEKFLPFLLAIRGNFELQYLAPRFKQHTRSGCNNCTVRADKYKIPLHATAIRDYVRTDSQINDAIYAFQQLSIEDAAFSKQEVSPLYCVPNGFTHASNFNPFFNVLHDYVPIVAKSAKEDLLLLENKGMKVEYDTGSNEGIIKAAVEIASRIGENEELFELFSTFRSFVESLQKESFKEGELDSLESKAEEYQKAKLKHMPCESVEFHKLSAHLRDYVTRFGSLLNGVHIPAPTMDANNAHHEIKSMLHEKWL